MALMRSIELFSGAGGLAYGLERAGFQHAMLIEQSPHACQTLSHNFSSMSVYCKNIQSVDFHGFHDIDLISGGPPCQPFSLGGKHQGQDDIRNLFPEAIRAIREVQPKAFLFENVKGILRSGFSPYFDYILYQLANPLIVAKEHENWWSHRQRLSESKSPPAYKVYHALLNAADYGVPQTRERVFLVGIRHDQYGDWTFPSPTHHRDRLLWDILISRNYLDHHNLSLKTLQIPESYQEQGDMLRSQYGMFPPVGQPWRTIRDVISDLPEPWSSHTLSDHLYRPGARRYKGHDGSDIDWPSKTIKAGDHGVPGGENMIRFHTDMVRYLTVLETKRIQTFPDTFHITGAWGTCMRQLGNAVPVLLAEVLGRQIHKFLGTGSQRQAA